MKRLTILLSAPILACMTMVSYAADKVDFAVDWVISGIHAGYFVAQDKGYYKDADIDVQIMRGFGSGDTVKRVAAGSAQFGLADTGAVIAARANDDIPVHIVAMIYDKATLGVIYNEGVGIEKPEDLIGKNLARSASGASVNMFPGFLKANDIDRSQINEIVVDAATFMPMLMSGQADAVLEQGILAGKFKRAAAEYGKSVGVMLYSDYGMLAYGTALITQDALLKENPELVTRFTEASLRGLADALSNPDEAIDVLLKSNPEVDRDGAMDELLALKDISSSDDVMENGLGYIRAEKMQETIDTITDALSLPRRVEPAELYTLEYLPQEPIFFGSQ